MGHTFLCCWISHLYQGVVHEDKHNLSPLVLLTVWEHHGDGNQSKAKAAPLGKKLVEFVARLPINTILWDNRTNIVTGSLKKDFP